MGDTVTIHGNPSRDGSSIVHVGEIIPPNGTEKYAADLNPAVTDRLLEERRRRD